MVRQQNVPQDTPGPTSSPGIVSGTKNGEASERPTIFYTPGPTPTPGKSDVIAVVNTKGIIRAHSPLPVRQPKRNRKRKAEISVIVTSSPYKKGVRCSSVVRAVAHGAMFRRIYLCAISRSSQCSTTGVTKAVVCVILSMV